MSDHDMQAQRECPKQIWQRSFLFPSAETNVSYQGQDKKIETQNLINFSDLPGFSSSLELAFSWSSWFSSLSPFAPGCCNKRCRFREGFTKKVAVLLDFFQMRGGPAQFFWHLFISALLVNKRSLFQDFGQYRAIMAGSWHGRYFLSMSTGNYSYVPSFVAPGHLGRPVSFHQSSIVLR